MDLVAASGRQRTRQPQDPDALPSPAYRLSYMSRVRWVLALRGGLTVSWREHSLRSGLGGDSRVAIRGMRPARQRLGWRGMAKAERCRRA